MRRFLCGMVVLGLLLAAVGQARSASIYWSNFDGGDIRRANLDGSGPETLVRNLNAPSGIALDLSNSQLYWTDAGGSDIRRANLDGTGQKTLITGLSGPAVITLDLSPLRPPCIQMPTQAASTFMLNWSALMGRAYQVQFKGDWTQINWVNLGGPRTATNTTMTASDAVASNPQRFYRVILLP